MRSPLARKEDLDTFNLTGAFPRKVRSTYAHKRLFARDAAESAEAIVISIFTTSFASECYTLESNTKPTPRRQAESGLCQVI